MYSIHKNRSDMQSSLIEIIHAFMRMSEYCDEWETMFAHTAIKQLTLLKF